MPIAAIIVTHGDVGRSMLASIERTLGPQTDAEFISNEGLALDQLEQRVRAQLDARPAILFVDFCGGSPYAVCRTCHSSHPHSAVISGVNLPMLISFFTKRTKLPFAELVSTVKADGLRGIELLTE
jgi:mannose PTS system EIIA component